MPVVRLSTAIAFTIMGGLPIQLEPAPAWPEWRFVAEAHMTAQAVIALIVQVGLFLVVAAAGLQARWGDFRRAFGRPRLLLCAVHVAVPVGAVLAALVLPIPLAVKAGIIIMAVWRFAAAPSDDALSSTA